MCGIFGYIGKKNAARISIEGLKRLEYRGYDSAGIGWIERNQIHHLKEVGKVSILEKEVESANIHPQVAIAQTRWATHGKPTKENAHPHLSQDNSLAIVHNGIIENYEALRESLEKKGFTFRSQTDTEVIAHLIQSFYEGNLTAAVQQAVSFLKGSFAFALIHKDYPDQIIAVCHESPMVIGIGENEAFVSSDTHAFAFFTRQVIYLSRSEIAVVKADEQQIFNAAMIPIIKKSELLDGEAISYSKGDFEHYTLKEIYDQPQAIRNAILSRFLYDYGTAAFSELPFEKEDLLAVERILILGCGTSWHAGYAGSYLIEEKARIPVQIEISSEFRYKNPVVSPGTLVIAISQSGETADTIAAVRELKEKGAPILALCNVKDSTLYREADCTILLRAGVEIGVCSTKAFTSQVVILVLLAILFGRMRNMDKQEGQKLLDGLLKLPDQVQSILDRAKEIEKLAEKYYRFENFFYIGRHYMYPTCLEGALKLKEISYINANGYPAGEMKHGPIALINETCPTVALCGNQLTFEKMVNNLMEIKARNGSILAIAEEGDSRLNAIADDLFVIPKTLDELAVITSAIPLQLLAYFIAKKRDANIDQPRNLAKSVTVE